MKKIIITLLLFGIVMISGFTFADGANDYTLKAESLKAIGLFSGSAKGFELNRAPGRVEAAVMLVRLLGKEGDVKANTYSHPFNDVPTWASNYIGYLYSNHLTKGISETEFGSNRLVDANSYATFVLRALGYSDAGNDFEWATALDFAAEKGILTQAEKKGLKTRQFLRGEMVLLSYGTLKTNVKDTSKPLIDTLIDDKAVDSFTAVTNGIAETETYRSALAGKSSLSFALENVDTQFSSVSSFFESNQQYVSYHSDSQDNPNVESITLSVPSGIVPDKNILARLSYYNQGTLKTTIYLRPSELPPGESGTVLYGYKVKSAYDEIKVDLFEPNAFDIYTMMGKASVLKIPVSKIKTALTLMGKAAYVQTKYIGSENNLVSTESRVFEVLTRSTEFRGKGDVFYLDDQVFYKDAAIVNQYKVDGKMYGNPPKIYDSSTAGLTYLNPRLDKNLNPNGAYDLRINLKEPSYFILRDENFIITSVIILIE